MSKRPSGAGQAFVARGEPSRVVIGWSVKVDLPLWGVFGIRAKVDSGARTSALHVAHVHLVEPKVVAFEVIRRSKRGKEIREKRVPVMAHVRRQTRVRSSTGQSEVRYIVATEMRIGAITKEVEISLASRDSMRYRMLLGRSALGPDFLIDTSRAGIHL